MGCRLFTATLERCKISHQEWRLEMKITTTIKRRPASREREGQGDNKES